MLLTVYIIYLSAYTIVNTFAQFINQMEKKKYGWFK